MELGQQPHQTNASSRNMLWDAGGGQKPQKWDTGIVDRLPLLQKLALDSIPRARQALLCAEITTWCKAATHSFSLHSLQSLDKMLPGLENTFCTQLQADNAAVHQPAAEYAREGQGSQWQSRRECGEQGRKEGERKGRSERRTEGPRGAEILQALQELGSPGWLYRLGLESGDT